MSTKIFGWPLRSRIPAVPPHAETPVLCGIAAQKPWFLVLSN
jgi:hypothetical protein